MTTSRTPRADEYQNILRNQLLQQMEKCLFTRNKDILINAKDKHVLNDNLNQERLIKPEERDFFQEEFEALFREPDASPHGD